MTGPETEHAATGQRQDQPMLRSGDGVDAGLRFIAATLRESRL